MTCSVALMGGAGAGQGSQEPVPFDDTATTLRDQQVAVAVTLNDRNPDPARLHVVHQPRNGHAEVNQRTATIVYTPNRDFTGIDEFPYDYCPVVDPDAAAAASCPSATVTVTVTKPPPVPVDDTATTTRDQAVTVAVTKNDRDPEPARLQVVGPPAKHGTATAHPDQATIVYTPDAGFTGNDEFHYDYCLVVEPNVTGPADCPSATVTVTVGSLPVISSVSPASTPPNQPVKVAGSTGSCNQQGALVVLAMGMPDLSVPIAGDQNGNFTAAFTVPKATVPGTYKLELRVTCGQKTQVAGAELAVVNHAPVAVDDTAATTQDTPVTIAVTANDTDPDGDDGYQTSLEATSPAHGTTQVPQRAGSSVLYTPDKGFVGHDQFDYTYCDEVVIPNAAGQVDSDCDTATVTVTVTGRPVISSVRPSPVPPGGGPVEVGGNTSSCNRAGTLIFHGMVDVPVSVTADQSGNFTARFTVPKGTFPRVYQLELRVDCNGQLQRAEGLVSVTNHAPVAVADTATTTQDRPVAIAVAANDRDPDGDEGYQTYLVEQTLPANGSTQVRSDATIVYTPNQGFTGRDQFRYMVCDSVINAAGGADCSTATVTVTVTGSGGPATTKCAPPAGSTTTLEVDPVKGAGGVALRIAATVDRTLAACPLRLLLGGAPLGPDIPVGSDGSISVQRLVPNTATAGTSTLGLATTGGQLLAETPFEILSTPIGHWWQRLPRWLRLLLAAGAFLIGVLAQAGLRRWRKHPKDTTRDRNQVPGEVQVKPYPSAVDATVSSDPDTPTVTVRLEPRPDAGTYTLKQVTT